MRSWRELIVERPLIKPVDLSVGNEQVFPWFKGSKPQMNGLRTRAAWPRWHFPAGVCLVGFLALVTDIQSANAGPTCGLYQYKATIVRVIDGDTVVADIDLGFHTWRRDEHLRVARIDAPEMKGASREEGQRSRAALISRIEGRELTICTIKDQRGKFGRYLVELWDGDVNLNDWMISEGYAVPYE